MLTCADVTHSASYADAGGEEAAEGVAHHTHVVAVTLAAESSELLNRSCYNARPETKLKQRLKLNHIASDTAVVDRMHEHCSASE